MVLQSTGLQDSLVTAPTPASPEAGVFFRMTETAAIDKERDTYVPTEGDTHASG